MLSFSIILPYLIADLKLCNRTFSPSVDVRLNVRYNILKRFIKKGGELMEVITPTNARKNLYGIIKHVVSDSQPVEIASTKEEESVIMISKSDWNSLQETIYLQNAGVLDRIKHFDNEESEDLGEIDWDTM